MTIAVNPQTGNVVYFDNDAQSWVPAQVATNPQSGESVAFDGNAWLPFQKPAPPPPPPARPAESLGDVWDKPTPGSVFDLAKMTMAGVQAPGRAVSGQYNVTPEVPGQWSEADEFRQQHAAEQMRKDAGALAGTTLLGSMPRVALGQAGEATLGMGFNRPPTAGAASTPSVPGRTPAPSIPPMSGPGELVETAGRVGVDIPRFLSDPSRTTQGVAAGLKNIPGAGDRIATATDQTVRGLGDAVTRVAEGYGTGSPAVAGGAAKDALSNWITEGSKRVANRLYDAVDPLVNQSVTVPLTATAKAAQSILSRRANAKIPGKSVAVETIMDAATSEGLNYQGVKGLRSFLGEMTPEQLTASGMREGEVKLIYAALSQDLRSTIQKAGGAPAVAKFERANSIFQDIKARRDALGKIIGTRGDAAPEAVFSRLAAMAGSKSTADIARLGMARKAVGPEAWNEFASAIVGRMGRDTRGEFSVGRFLTAYGNMTPAGRTSLFNTTGRDSLGRSIHDIARVSKEIEAKLAEFANPSGTARSLTATGFVMDILHHPIRALSTVTGGNYLAKVLSEPASAQLTAQWLKAYRDALVAPSVNSSQAVKRAADKLANAIVAASGAGNAGQIAAQLSLTGITASPQQFGRSP